MHRPNHLVRMGIMNGTVQAAGSESTAPEPRKLIRVLRIREGLGIVIGSLIGMGILRTPGLIAGYLGDPWYILGIWFLGGVVGTLSALLFAEMAASFPQAGGKYVYAREAFGPVAGFVAGWSEFAVIKAFSGAAKAVVIAEYMVLVTGHGSIRILAVLVVLAVAAINLAGLRPGTVFQNITTLVKVLILIGIAAAGFSIGDA